MLAGSTCKCLLPYTPTHVHPCFLQLSLPQAVGAILLMMEITFGAKTASSGTRGFGDKEASEVFDVEIWLGGSLDTGRGKSSFPDEHLPSSLCLLEAEVLEPQWLPRHKATNVCCISSILGTYLLL